MRYTRAGLQDSIVGTYDQTKTTIQGRSYQKTVEGELALGPPLNVFSDIQTDSGITMTANNHYMTDNGRIFILGGEAAGATPLICYSINYSTGATSYIGRVNIILPDVAATTTTYRSIKVLDSGTTGWKVFISTTGSVLINGGTLLVNSLDLADFSPIGFPSIPFATGNNQKAVYFLQDATNLGVNHLQTASAGSVLHISANRLYVHNGVSATHQYYVFDTSIAPTYSTASVTGLAATDVVSDVGHTFSDNDQVTFTSLTGGAGLTVGTTYFVRSSIAGVSYQLSATSGGAAINFTTDITSASLGRAFGITPALFLFKTGNLPALTGTLLLTNSENYSMPGHTSNSGFDCAFFATSSNLYLGRLSELTIGAVTWPSLITVNLLGTANEIVSPVATYAAWSNDLDRAVYSTGVIFVIKSFLNNNIETIFGGTSNRFLEGLVGNEVVEFQFTSAISSINISNGWISVINLTAGQRGLILADLRSDATYDYSFLVTKVLDTPQAVYKFITTIDSLFDYTGSLKIYYRTSGFGSISGGWIEIPFAQDLSGFTSGQQTQFKIKYSTLGLDTSIPAQLRDAFIGYESLVDNSPNWELSVDDSDNGNPSRTAFRLKTAYASTVPTLYYRAYDLSDVNLVTHNTVTNAAQFEYSSNNGISWNAVGVIPNVVGTLLRYTFAAPPGVDIRPGIKES